jgi:ribosomal-protein-alanine N-acetyltransferase
MSEVSVLAMTEADLADVLAIERASYPSPWDESVYRSELGHPWSHCLVAKRDGRVLGTMVFWMVAGEAELLNVATHPEHRGQGIARRLLEHLLGHAGRAHAGRVHLEVRRSNAPAIALYERLGFTHVAVRQGYYRDNLEDALIMQKVMDADE